MTEDINKQVEIKPTESPATQIPPKTDIGSILMKKSDDSKPGDLYKDSHNQNKK
jgi:hypothetical protein